MSDMDKTHSAHPSPRKYLMVASALVVLTAIAVSYTHQTLPTSDLV